MIVLGFDTSTPATAIGLRLPDGRTLQARDDPDRNPPPQRPGHATRLLPLAANLLEQAGLSWREVERIAVGVGPGGFTGLRVGVASARGLAQSLGAELVGVSSLRALAAGALDVGAAGVLAAIDARRGEMFVSAYTRGQNNVHGQMSDVLTEQLSPRPVLPRDCSELLDLVRTNGPTPITHWIAVGNGAVLYRTELERAGVEVPADGEAVHMVSAAAICRIAADADAQPIETVIPDYLRLPDAEIALERRRAQSAAGVAGAPRVTGAPA